MSEAIQCVLFDAYGTLFDVQSVVSRCQELFPDRGHELSRLWRDKQLEYTWLRSLMQRYEDFDSITRAALVGSCRVLGLEPGASVVSQLMHEYHQLAAYPDVLETLERLGQRRRAILSNGAPASLRTVVRNAGLADRFDAIISVDPLQVYKPHPRVYQSGVDRLRVPKETIAFVSSNFWDVCGATAFGFWTLWVNRAGAQPDELGLEPSAVLGGLAELPAAPSRRAR